MKKVMTLSEIRREASMKGVAVRQERAKRDPLTTISVRTSDKARLQVYADEQGITLTEAFHRKV
jgi:hypothetical protein